MYMLPHLTLYKTVLFYTMSSEDDETPQPVDTQGLSFPPSPINVSSNMLFHCLCNILLRYFDFRQSQIPVYQRASNTFTAKLI